MSRSKRRTEANAEIVIPVNVPVRMRSKSRSKAPTVRNVNVNVGARSSASVGKSKSRPSRGESKRVLSKINELINEENDYQRNRVEPLQWVMPNKKEFSQWVTQTFLKYRQDGHEEPRPANGSLQPYKYQKFLRDYMQRSSPYRGILLYHGLGSGKCHSPGTLILMYDGSMKPVEEITVGEIVMGDDSGPRTVVSLAQGEEEMYEIVLHKNNRFGVNKSHILALRVVDPAVVGGLMDFHIYQDNVVFLSVGDYLGLSEEVRAGLHLYIHEIQFPAKPLDGEDGDAYLYGQKIGVEWDQGIDQKLLLNEIGIRRDLLNGLIQGPLCQVEADNGEDALYTFTTPSTKLRNDLIYLASSLGYYVEWEFEEGSSLYHIHLSRNEDHGSHVPFSVEACGIGEYFGFTLQEDPCYVLGNFVVTHNTLSSIFIAENLKSDRNIVFLSPASLKPNFIEYGLKKLPIYAEGNGVGEDRIRQKYSFVSFNASNTVDQIEAIGGFDNKVIIIEETHNLVSKMLSGLMGSSKQGEDIYNYLMNAKNCKIVALTGSPAINDPFEMAVLFNVLRGYIEVTRFRIVSVGPEYGARWEKMEDLKRELLEIPFVDYVDVNKVNQSFEFHLTVKSYDERYTQTLEAITSLCGMRNVDARFLQKDNFSLFPIENEGETFYEYFVDVVGDTMKLKNEDLFKRRILGLVSYYKASEESIPTRVDREYYRVKMSDYQYQIYEILREKERKTEKGSNSGGKGRKKKKVQSTKSTFRVFSRQASNFVFPEEIHRPYPDPTFVVDVANYGKKDKAGQAKNLQMMAAEERANEEGEMEDDYKERVAEALAGLSQRGEVYFRAGPQGLDKLSPKMKIMLENIQQSPGLVFVYSNFRTVEGVEIFSRVLDFNGFARYGDTTIADPAIPRYAIYSGTEDIEEKTRILKIFTSPENKLGSRIKIIMATSAGAEGLDLKNIRQIHIMEPYWNQVRIRQVIGRGVRRDSHVDLPPADRNVEVFRYFSALTPMQASKTKEKLATDEHIEQISLKKQGIIDELELCMKEAAVDCMLNSPFIKGNYKCYSFPKDATGFAYMPSLQSDLISSYAKVQVRTVKREYLKGYYHVEEKRMYVMNPQRQFYAFRDATKRPVAGVDVKKLKRFAVDPESGDVYDYASVEAKNPVLVGVVNESGAVVRKR